MLEEVEAVAVEEAVEEAALEEVEAEVEASQREKEPEPSHTSASSHVAGSRHAYARTFFRPCCPTISSDPPQSHPTGARRSSRRRVALPDAQAGALASVVRPLALTPMP